MVGWLSDDSPSDPDDDDEVEEESEGDRAFERPDLLPSIERDGG